MNKVILISIDGMRPDGLQQCQSPFLPALLKKASYTFSAKTVFPSITLPCHLSMFHSIPPERHGTFSNDFVKPVRPVNGLFEQLSAVGKQCAMYYGWEPLRDIGKVGTLVRAEYIHSYSFDHTDEMLTDRALAEIRQAHPDFVFLYLVETDEKGGHDAGWMSETYLSYIRHAIGCVQRVSDETDGEYSIIVTADHGGHDRIHGTDSPEDMTIPIFAIGPQFAPDHELHDVSILDIAPTVAEILGVPAAREWQGRSLIGRED